MPGICWLQWINVPTPHWPQVRVRQSPWPKRRKSRRWRSASPKLSSIQTIHCKVIRKDIQFFLPDREFANPSSTGQWYKHWRTLHARMLRVPVLNPLYISNACPWIKRAAVAAAAHWYHPGTYNYVNLFLGFDEPSTATAEYWANDPPQLDMHFWKFIISPATDIRLLASSLYFKKYPSTNIIFMGVRIPWLVTSKIWFQKMHRTLIANTFQRPLLWL